MKEFLNPDQGYKLIRCEVGETPIPDNWIEIPEGSDFCLMFDSIELCFYKKTEDEPTLLLWNKVSKKWTDTNYQAMESILLNKGVDFIWKREKVEVEFDNVNHPKHYTGHPSGIECIEITRHHDFAIGNAIKYLWRAGLKDSDNEVQDLEKAVWYIQDKIKQLKG